MAVRYKQKKIHEKNKFEGKNNQVFNPVESLSKKQLFTKEIELVPAASVASLVNISRAKKSSGAVPLKQLEEYASLLQGQINNLLALNNYLAVQLNETIKSIPTTGDLVRFQKLTFTGAIDGSNKIFTITSTNYLDIMPIWSGIKLYEGSSQGYTLSGNDVELDEPPQTGDSFEIWGNIPYQVMNVFQILEYTGVKNGVNTVFIITSSFTDLMPIHNGVTLQENHVNGYTLSGSTVTFATPPEGEDSLIFWGNSN